MLTHGILCGIISKRESMYIAHEFDENPIAYSKSLRECQQLVLNYYSKKINRSPMGIKYQKACDGLKYIIYKSPRARIRINKC